MEKTKRVKKYIENIVLVVANHAVQRPPQLQLASDAPRDHPPTGLSLRSLKQDVVIKYVPYTEDLHDTRVSFIQFMLKR